MTPSPEDSARVGKDLAFSIDLIVRATLALDEKICRDMERIAPDGIVADSMAFWGKLAAQKLGIPFLSSTTTFAFNRASAKVMGQGMGSLFPWCGGAENSQKLASSAGIRISGEKCFLHFGE